MLKPRLNLSKLATLTCALLLSATAFAAPNRPAGDELSAQRAASVISGLVDRNLGNPPVEANPALRPSGGKFAVFIEGQLALVVPEGQVEAALVRLAQQRRQLETDSGRNDSYEVCLSTYLSLRGSGHYERDHEGLDCDQLPF